ncbi:MAG: MoaD/ThiS family protein [Myxococcota bacterium]|jgi:molybdopterin converting factor small subunit
MATVILPARFSEWTGGVEQVDVDARDVRQLIRALDERFPGLGEKLRDGTAIAIDGEIINDPLLEPIEPDSEVHFLPPVSGG